MQNHLGSQMKPGRPRDATTAGRTPATWPPIVLGLLSVVLFWLPLLAPFIQLAAAVESLRAICRGVIGGWGLSVGLGGAVIGFALFLIVEYLWVI